MQLKKIGNYLGILTFLLLGGCASMSSHVTPTMDNASYLKATAEQRASYQATIKSERETLAEKWQAELQTGRPVLYGDSGTKYTLQKVVLPGDYDLLAYYPGHNPEGLDGRNSEGMVVLVTDKNGKVLYKDGRPVAVLANVATNNDTGRDILTGLVPALFNGTVPALVNHMNDCGNNCSSSSAGTTIVNQGGSSFAGAFSASDANSNASVKGGMPMK